ncbi:hypothetical protein AVEN_110114-1 [Araneus ventricosus]|uniref:Uncharacterized protein n=1 Tax=Araneus ventricosus TaxID=182803 RepID=A0A4Y2NLA7_ARAVE|nr:hypothetical protein AVEN_110114-1 [Araneus ventricosus]
MLHERTGIYLFLLQQPDVLCLFPIQSTVTDLNPMSDPNQFFESTDLISDRVQSTESQPLLCQKPDLILKKPSIFTSTDLRVYSRTPVGLGDVTFSAR